MRTRITRALVGAWVALGIVAAAPAALASQGSTIIQTTGLLSGLAAVNAMNAALAALVSCNSGATAPTNSGVTPPTGQTWCDTSVVNVVSVKQYDGTAWLLLGTFDQVNHVWAPAFGGGSGTIASAGSTDLGTVASAFVTVSGTATINSFGSSAVLGALKVLQFSGILTLTNSGSLALPNGGSNVTTRAGDTALAAYMGSGNWVVTGYQRADGTALSSNTNFTGALTYTGAITPTALSSGTTNDWAPTGFAGSNRIRASSSGAATLTGLAGGATGRQIIFDNIGAFTIVLTSNDAGSASANRFALPRPVALRPYDSITLIYDGPSALWRAGAITPTNPITGSYKNLLITNNAGNPDDRMDAAADEVVLVDPTGVTWTVTGFSDTAATNASGASGLDTGSVLVNRFYAEWAIGNPTTQAAKLMFSLSGTAPVMPAGYTFKALLGWNRTDGSFRFYRVGQVDNVATYKVTAGVNNTNVSILLTSGASASYDAVNPTLVGLTVRGTGGITSGVPQCVPPTARAINLAVTSTYRNAAAGGIFVAPNANWGGATNGPLGSAGNVYPFYNSGYTSSTSGYLELESDAIWYNAAANGSAIACLGWRDARP